MGIEHNLKNEQLLSFIPHRLEIEGLPELCHFPFNVLFANYTMKDGKQVFSSALYKPDFYTYKKDGHLSCMRYHNIYGGDCYLVITHNKNNGRYCGEKFVNGKSVGLASGGDNWDLFFAHFTILGLANGEQCQFDNTEKLEGV